MSSFWQFFDIQMAIFRRVDSHPVVTEIQFGDAIAMTCSTSDVTDTPTAARMYHVALSHRKKRGGVVPSVSTLSVTSARSPSPRPGDDMVGGAWCGGGRSQGRGCLVGGSPQMSLGNRYKSCFSLTFV